MEKEIQDLQNKISRVNADRRRLEVIYSNNYTNSNSYLSKAKELQAENKEVEKKIDDLSREYDRLLAAYDMLKAAK